MDQRWVTDVSGTITDVDRYTYDRNSNRTEKNNSLSSGLDEDYTYDGLNRLQTTDRSTGTANDQSSALDALGNMTTVTTNSTPQSRTHNSRNQLTAMGGSSLAYDANGNVTTDDHGYTLIYDGWNRLVQVKNGSTVLKTYAYDGLGRRISETAGSNVTHLYYTSSWQLIEERLNGSGVAKRQYVWSPVYVDALILRDRDVNNISGDGMEERLYATQDANFNVTAIANASGTVQQRFAYNAYGAKQVLNATWGATTDTKNWVVGDQGLFEDVTIGWIHNRDRIYSASMMRFGQQDPLGYEDGLNSYQVIHDNPLIAVDPLGTKAQCNVNHAACTIKIILNITFIPTRGEERALATTNIAQRAKTGIESAWNGGWMGGRNRNYRVSFEANTQYVPLNYSDKGQVINQPTDDNVVKVTTRTIRDYVRGRSEGLWSTAATDWVYAHEAGHLMGLGDQYHDTPGGSVPNPGWAGNIMGLYNGVVEQKNIDELTNEY